MEIIEYCFSQSLPYADAMNKTLVFAIFDFDRFSKHDQIGEVKVPLCTIDLAQTIEEWRDLVSVEGEGGQVCKDWTMMRSRKLQNIFEFSLITYYVYIFCYLHIYYLGGPKTIGADYSLIVLFHSICILYF